MPLRFNCQNCDARIRVPDGSEGRKVRCPRCGALQHVQAKPEVKITVRPESVRELARGLEARAGGGAVGGGRLSVASATAVAEPAASRGFEDDVASGSDNDDSAPWVLRDLRQSESSCARSMETSADGELGDRAEQTQQEEPPTERASASLKLVEERSLEQPSSVPAAAADSPTGLEEAKPASAEVAAGAASALAVPETVTVPVDNDPIAEVPAPQVSFVSQAQQASAPVTDAEPIAVAQSLENGQAEVVGTDGASLAVAAAAAAPPQGLPLSRPKAQAPAAPIAAPAPPAAVEPAPAMAAVQPPVTKPSRPLKPILPPLPQYASLLTVAWVLRFLAAMAVGGVLRVMDAHRQNFQSMAVTFRDLIWGLIGVTLVWAAAEMVAAVRDLLIRGARETR